MASIRNPVSPRNRVSTLILCVFGIFAVSFSAFIPATSESIPISISSQGELGNNHSSKPSLSTDGRFVAFESLADNLVSDDSNQVADIFVHDRLSGETSRFSISTIGEQTDTPAANPDISANGRFVAFQSTATSLVPTNSQPTTTNQIYVHDRLNGITERVSVNDRGESGAGNSINPSISGDGRYVAFQSEASNLVLNDPNGAADVFIRDRLTGHTILASPGGAANLPSGKQLHISEDGRTVVFTSEAANLAVAIVDDPRIYLYKRVLVRIEYINLPVDKAEREIVQLRPSAAANIVAALTQIESSGYEVILFDHLNGRQQTVDTFEANDQPPQIALSADGKDLAALLTGSEIRRYDLPVPERQTVITGENLDDLTLSSDGSTIAYTQETEGITQVFVLDADEAPGHTLSGRVTDATGHPLSLVTVKTSNGFGMRTDGNGNFFFSGLPPGTASLVPTKDGFNFEPEQIPFEASSDLNGLHFQASHENVLKEARADLGMPYNFNRGGSGSGRFHGYAAGYCTDLILDAYSWGADYHIQFALEQDYRANPDHVYRWRDARNANDMWRYFAYSGQMLPHAAPYQPGDIVFFDWSEDGEIDHVAIVSEVNYLNRSEMMYDATGVIASNLSGRAAELPREAFHEQTERGHARWSGQLEPIVTQLPGGEYLQVLVGSAQVELSVRDPNGNLLSERERRIPGGIFLDLGWEQSLSIHSPRANGETYTVEIKNVSDAPAAYQFLAHTIQEGIVTERVEFKEVLEVGEVYPVDLELRVNADDKFLFSAREIP